MLTYKESGVDKEAGYRTVKAIRQAVKATANPNVLSELGSFGALYKLSGYREPILVSGTDGVGTKLKVAIAVGQYDTIGIDCFAMCANDILCHGAKPLFFLDYLACGKLNPEIAAEIVGGMAKACRETGTALVGGETAEMPDMYREGDCDIAGFCVGVVEKANCIDGTRIRTGDIILGLPASGLHSNGFSLVRKALPDFCETFGGKPLYKTLLTPTRLYHHAIHALLDSGVFVHGLAHITGGGLPENLPRITPKGLTAVLDLKAIPTPDIFKHIQVRGAITDSEMYATFNMGVGMVVVVSPEQLERAQEVLETQGERCFVFGRVQTGSQKLILHD
ncbi:MAG: phosphoribosylformylglycinamidine cyclo-ligase [Flavobacteriales bacterium]